MGICESQETKAMIERSREIDRQLHQDFMQQKKVAKLLLLGAGEAGKTTMLKQMKILHANGFTEPERLEYREHVYKNVLDGMHAILTAMAKMRIKFENPNLEFVADLVMEIHKRGLQLNPHDRKLTTAIREMWADEAVRHKVLPKRNQFQFMENCIFFLNSLNRIVALDYVPTVEDILLLRIQTTEMVQVTYKIKDVNFWVVDVGGCRSERRKWIHCFDMVHAIIFISAISEFDQNTMETPSTNRLMESMRIFSSICNSRWFISTGVILFLNKRDLFEHKIRHQHKCINSCFKKYIGPRTFEAQVEYIRRKFVELNKNAKKCVWVHLTCATDTNQISLIWNNATDVIIESILQHYGIC